MSIPGKVSFTDHGESHSEQELVAAGACLWLCNDFAQAIGLPA